MDVRELIVSEVRREVQEALSEMPGAAKPVKITPSKAEKPTDVCKVLMWLFTGVFLVTHVMSAVSWLAFGEVPHELFSNIWLPYGIALSAYYGKDAYEQCNRTQRPGDWQ
ncbi:MAG: hypothetical protein FWD98_02605 [Defluviitaleaceae bacterium]|nr:hypothetical protein [Defluviitaleaceae bacterium]